MNNISLYKEVCALKDRLELHPDSTKPKIEKAISLIRQVNETLDIRERRA